MTQPPTGSALADLASGRPFNVVDERREELRTLLFELEEAVTVAEEREARMARRRQVNAGPMPDRNARGAPPARTTVEFVEREGGAE